MSSASPINTTSPPPRTKPAAMRHDAAVNQSMPRLLGIGAALPELVLPQNEIERELAMQWRLRGTQRNRWQRICRGATVAQRHGVLPIAKAITLSTAERMARFESFAPPLAEQAARHALAHAGLAAHRVTDLVVVSCTGFSAPGLDVALMRRLKLRDTVRRTMIGFMGCFGAINGLRSAVGACAADPSSITLVVCCELCSLHIRNDPRPDNQVACALFGDGAAAAVVGGDAALDAPRSPIEAMDSEGAALGRLTLGRSRLIPASEELMSWRITDTGFAMTLDRQTPMVLRSEIASFVEEGSTRMPQTIVPHPGGPGVLDAIGSALPPRYARGIDIARDVLRRCGNMSSGTVLFVLERLIRHHNGHDSALPAKLLAFGPGLTMEQIEVAPMRE